jgi:uncharacterized protein
MDLLLICAVAPDFTGSIPASATRQSWLRRARSQYKREEFTLYGTMKMASDCNSGLPSTILLVMISCAKWWLGVIVSLMLALAAQAEPVAQLKATDYVNDFAHVLDQNTMAQMDDICRQIDEKAHAQIAVVTVRSLDGADIESYAVDLFHQWGVGSKSTNRARIEVGYGLEPILPDGKVGAFQREAVPLMQAGNYNQALLLVTSRVAKVIADDAGIQLTNLQPEAPAEPENQPGGGLSIGAIVGIGIVILIILFTPLRGILFWILFSGMFGGGGSRGGGGW